MRTFSSGDKDFYAVKGTEADGSWFLCNIDEEGVMTTDILEAYAVRDDIAKCFPEVLYHVIQLYI